MQATTMAKKGRKPGTRAGRLGQVTGADLSALSASLQNLAGDLDSLAFQMSEHGVDSIEIDGVGMSDRGVEWIVKFVGKASDALVSVRYGR